MAQKLHTVYGFSYDTLKVLLGGWHGWENANAQDPAGYPIEKANPSPLVTFLASGDALCAAGTRPR